MKNLILLWFLFISIVSFGQQTYKVTEGELQFIHPKEGIFIKKENKIYKLDLENISDYEEIAKGFNYKLNNTTLEDVENLKNDPSTIFAKEITKYNFNKLEKTKFITKVTDDDNYQFIKYNKAFFLVGILEDSLQKPRNEYLFHYCILDFNNGKKIIYHSGGCIVPTKEKLNFLFDHYSLNKAFTSYSTINYNKLKANEIHLLNSDLELNGEFYSIDTLKNKKLRIKNRYNQTVINKKFDSIAFNPFFIVGYNKKTIAIYNYTLEQLNLKKVKAISFNKFYPTLQIIQNNKLRNINLIGSDFKTDDIAVYPGFNHFFPSNTVTIGVTKENNDFYIESEIFQSRYDNLNFENKYKIINSEKYESIQFLNEKTFITLYSEMGNYEKKYPILIYTKLKNGKYNLNTIDFLIDPKINDQSIGFNNLLPKNLDSIVAVNEDIYIIEKENLFTYYPLVKEIKYKKLEKFTDNFARFELPNGKKGWLGLDGKEYLDE
ncbi:hypothetical protein [Flavobacterium cerinum]|uniref:WG repeat-containing protein n=1 Tax=Flavobacterium cerinum TaxID=2502784 RepID=A0ABY5IW33_9FLAO|nr:hypothetical protein [Flavobacterium cerinum]UUC46874.1 hypothetical protein NOX80_06665 [Flavobacterium cerinum]